MSPKKTKTKKTLSSPCKVILKNRHLDLSSSVAIFSPCNNQARPAAYF